MGLFCCPGVFGTLARAAAKAASARLRRLGLRGQAADWARRASLCEMCHMRIVHRGVSYCGRPFLDKIRRVGAEDGCGCPCNDKAKDPSEHCPITPRGLPATTIGDECDCKWCSD
jgi:hypothetical protein